jgi:hypothetical protein
MNDVWRLRADAVEWRDVEGEVVAIDLRTETYLAVNESGAMLWRMLGAGATLDRLIGVLVGEYGVPREQAVADAEAFIQMLAANDLLDEK